MTRRIRPALCTVVALVALSVQPASAYLHLSFPVNGESVRLRWDSSRVRWLASDRPVPGVPASEFRAALQRAFSTWEAVPTASVAFEFGGLTSASPFEDDTLSVFGFLDDEDMDRVLGATSFLVDTLTGEIVESDVFFNTAFAWSTAPAGAAGRFDLESVALHEMGHFIGLGHSALGETEVVSGDRRRVLASGSVMFPIAFGTGNIADRELQPDDVAAVSDLYPDDNFRRRTGAVRGRVRLAGRGVLGAHVVAFHPASGALVGGFALNEDGEFQIAGLAPGAHVIRIEPLDDAEIDAFFSPDSVNVDFRVTYYERLFAAPAGGVGEPLDVEVRPK